MPLFDRHRRDERQRRREDRKTRPPLLERIGNWALGKVWALVWPWIVTGARKSVPWVIGIGIAIGAWVFRDKINQIGGVKPTQYLNCECKRWGEGKPCCDRCRCAAEAER